MKIRKHWKSNRRCGLLWFEGIWLINLVDCSAVVQLYLQGKSQEAIACRLNLEIKQVYRLREKISYMQCVFFSQRST